MANLWLAPQPYVTQQETGTHPSVTAFVSGVHWYGDGRVWCGARRSGVGLEGGVWDWKVRCGAGRWGVGLEGQVRS